MRCKCFVATRDILPSSSPFTPQAQRTSLSGVSKSLPSNVRLMTLTSNYADINDGQMLLRLAHMYSIGEHPTLAQPATVKLADVRAGIRGGDFHFVRACELECVTPLCCSMLATCHPPSSSSHQKVFAEASLKLKSVVAMSLTGNQDIESMDARKFDWKTADITGTH